MKTLVLRRKNSEIVLFFKIVNCDDIKIFCNFPNDFGFSFDSYLYYSLEKNILKYEYNDEDENVYIFTEKERNKIKRACLKLFLKEYNKISESSYKTQKLNIINKYLEL